jgi:putative FmdB family regulatory protein
MPSYEFQCSECSTTGTVTASMQETITMRCPRCNTFMKKVYSAPGLILKGSGWGKD